MYVYPLENIDSIYVYISLEYWENKDSMYVYVTSDTQTYER